MIRLTLEFNGFDTHLALKGIRWDDKKYFFDALEESIRSLNDEDDDNEQKQAFVHELALNHQSLRNFKLKLGHKNFIVNLCHELQSISTEEFNGAVVKAVVQVPETKRDFQGLIVRKQPEEHGYSREDEKRMQGETISLLHEVPVSEPAEEDQFEYESVHEEEGQTMEEQDYLELEDENELEVEDNEEIEYHELKREGSNSEEIYITEQILVHDTDQYEQSRFEISGYDSSSSHHRAGPKSKKPKHMYTSEFLQSQSTPGRIGTPGRRRPKLQKNYPDTDDGLLERWADLIRQSCEVIIPQVMLERHDLSHIDIFKLQENVWEVKCPLCTKKLRVQMTHEGKYTNYKRSNFERHLRIVHYSQIKQFKSDDPMGSGDDEIYAESH